jgi:ADP-ribose pyrophosphatase
MSEILGEGDWLRLVRKGRWEFVQRVNTTGIVVMIAVTDAGELLCVEQHRPAVDSRVIDVPAGLVGDMGDETLEEAAARELIEETGYEAERFERIATATPSPGLSTEVVTFLRARGVRKVGPGGGDATEDLVAHVVPLDWIDTWIGRMEAEGALVDAKLYAALHLLAKHP